MSAPLAPIVVFCYNRPQHLRQTLDALQRNTLATRSPLIIFSDGAKTEWDTRLVLEVRALLVELTGFESIEIIQAAHNTGLANSVIGGVSRVLQTYDRVIVLEDDMVSTPDFLDYMNTALETYQPRADIFSVTGYTPPLALPTGYPQEVYLAPRASSWGWGTWRNRWQQADWQVQDFAQLQQNPRQIARLNEGGDDLWPMLVKQQRGVIDSWAIRWTFAQMQHGAYGLYPVRSKIKNIGTDGSGTNFTFSSQAYGQELAEGRVKLPPEIEPDSAVLAAFRRYYKLPWRVKLKNRFKYRV